MPQLTPEQVKAFLERDPDKAYANRNVHHRFHRPLRFNDAKLLKEKVDEYFLTTTFAAWSITGLALHLGTCRDTLIDYLEGKNSDGLEKIQLIGREDIRDVIAEAFEKCAHAAEQVGVQKGRVFDIFRLKQFGWQDKVDVSVAAIKPQFVDFNNCLPEAAEVPKLAEGSNDTE